MFSVEVGRLVVDDVQHVLVVQVGHTISEHKFRDTRAFARLSRGAI